MVSKADFVQALLPVLQKTRHFSNLEDLVYDAHDSGQETVTAIYKDGFKKVANVTFDSNYAILKDVIRQLG